MPNPIPYPVINGVRASFTSLVWKIDGQEFAGFKSVNMSRKRERAVVRGANPDPLGKTRGTNTYEHSAEVYYAEFKAFVLDHFGAGYGDVSFSNELTITENGFDTSTNLAENCTIDTSDLSFSEGNEPLMVKIDFGPTKITFGGIDDNASPLQGAPAQA